MTLIYIANMRFPNEKAHGKQVREMCNAFVDLGEVHLVIPSRKTEGDPYEFGLDARVRVVRIPTPDTVHFGKAGFWLTALCFAVGSGAYVLSFGRDIRVVTRDYLCALVPALSGTPTVWESHRGEWNILTWFLRHVGGRFVLISNGLKNLYMLKGVPESHLLLAPDGVDLSRYQNLPTKAEARRQLGIAQECKMSIYNGHLHTWKGAGTLAQAARLLPDNFRVMFMGGTDEDIASFQEAYGDDARIMIIGRKSDKERPLYLRAADVAVLPNTAADMISAQYTSPLKLFGYMAAGVPIVSSDLPSIREILTEETAYFAEPDSPQSFADRLTEAVENPDEAIKKAHAARAQVDRYGWNNRARSILSFLER